MGEAVRFEYGTCSITLNLSMIHEMPLRKLRKLLPMMLSEPWKNQRAIDDMDAYIDAAVDYFDETRAGKTLRNRWASIEKCWKDAKQNNKEIKDYVSK